MSRSEIVTAALNTPEEVGRYYLSNGYTRAQQRVAQMGPGGDRATCPAASMPPGSMAAICALRDVFGYDLQRARAFVDGLQEAPP